VTGATTIPASPKIDGEKIVQQRHDDLMNEIRNIGSSFQMLR
jgi:hypothetical protein